MGPFEAQNNFPEVQNSLPEAPSDPYTVFKLVGKKNAKGPFDEAPHTVSIDPIDC